MNATAPHIIFAGGVTGGHLFPGLATARQLVHEMPRARITFVGSGREFERRHVADAGFDYAALPCHRFPHHVRETLRFVIDNLSGYRRARRFLDGRTAAVVVGLGGFASVPLAQAAAARGLPLVLLEANAVPGRATRWLARRATVVCAAFDLVRRQLPKSCRVIITGTPIDEEFSPPARIVAMRPPSLRPADSSRFVPQRLVVLGGSRGSAQINRCVPPALYRVRDQLSGWSILHQSGPRDVEATGRLYSKLGLTADVQAFIADVPDVLRSADVAISRAGGATLAEMAACGTAAVLLPDPQATDDHQARNAAVLAAAGACRVVDCTALGERLDVRLARLLNPLLCGFPLRDKLSLAIGRLARPGAARHVARVVASLAGRRQHRRAA